MAKYLTVVFEYENGAELPKKLIKAFADNSKFEDVKILAASHERIEVSNSISPHSFGCKSIPVNADDTWVSVPRVRESMIKKLNDIKPTFDELTEIEYGDWLDSLEFPEFLELMDMCPGTL